MTFEVALRLMEILMGLAFIQQSVEHLYTTPRHRVLYGVRIILCVFLIAGVFVPAVCVGLFIIALTMLHLFQGPYNGGSDRMSLLMLFCVMLIHVLPSHDAREMVFGYLALQVILSYFIAGWVKVVNHQWRSGQALVDVFHFSIYPTDHALRSWVNHPRVLLIAGWMVMIFELAFPLFLLTQTSLMIGLCLAALFHMANYYLFGFNRFVWIWIASYPSLFWLQGYIL